ncbi:MAG: hypothetical protein P9L97_01160 [Candidatus Tenebribacter davisii]|nr:hypothetical protein [Candidatus Tenebribacter davisii]
MSNKVKLIKCRTCGKMVSSKAKRCKYCGTVLRMSFVGIIITLGFVLSIIAIILLGIFQG